MRSLLLLPIVFTTLPSMAVDVFVYDGPDADSDADVLIPDTAWPSWAARGTGAPTVAYDEGGDQWVMLFEARLSDDFVAATGKDFDACRANPDGPPIVWGVGRATSPDGVTGWSVDPNPVLLPEPGTWRHCQVAHPWVVSDVDGWHLYFKAEQVRDPCPDGDTPPWGCERMTGVGYARSTDGGASWDVQGGDLPLLQVGDFGYPTVVGYQDEGAAIDDVSWFMLLTQGTDLLLATSDQPDGGWSLYAGNPVLQPGALGWSDALYFQPSLTCGPVQATFPMTAWLGGEGSAGSGVDDLGTQDGTEFFASSTPTISWPGPAEWRHWDAVRNGGETLLYYTVRGDDNKLRVSLAKVGDDDLFAPDPDGGNERTCLFGDQPEPTDETDTDEPVDTDPTDTDDPEPEPDGCYCSASASPMSALPGVLAVLGLVALRRRRRG